MPYRVLKRGKYMATKTKKPAKPKLVPALDGTNKDSKRVLVEKDIKVKLSEKEITKMARENGKTQLELDNAKDILAEKTKEFKEFKKPQDAKIKELSETIARTNREIDTGEATRKLPCGVVFDYEANAVHTFYPADSQDPKNIVETRTMDAKERQLSLIPEEAEAIAKGIPEEGMEARE